ncbi:MAG: ABC transporter substrate-binding protein [Geobacter sp.]|nr:MAG: ABC transporter substrate-binding protein [Geobacter sp.]
MRIKLLLLSLLFTCFNMTGPVAVKASVTDEVKKTVDEVVRIVADKELKKPQNEAKRRQLLKTTVAVIFDYEEMARRSLGKHWKERTPAERKEFVQLFTTLLENSYADKIESYNQEKIVYLKESMEGDHAEVRSKVVTAKRDEYSLDYRLLNKGGKWMVYDVVIEGVSLVSNYRGQFNKIVASQGYPQLVKKLRTKSEEIKAP